MAAILSQPQCVKSWLGANSSFTVEQNILLLIGDLADLV